jgi:hypothetical protein
MSAIAASIERNRDINSVEPLAQEADDIGELCSRLALHATCLKDDLERIRRDLTLALRAAKHPLEAEFACERAARALRATWLQSVAAETAQVFRSPTEIEARRLADAHDVYGYERDFQPLELETRCAAYFPSAPEPWRCDHIFYSSGQAALASALLTLTHSRSIRIAHLGSYFETRCLIERCFGGLHQDPGAASIVIAEPIACDGAFTRIELETLIGIFQGNHAPRTLIIDTTLLGYADPLPALCAELPPGALVLRFASGLKLMQAGLELANVGILSIYAVDGDRLAACGRDIRRARTLTGSGLRFAEALALGAPWFLDPAYARRYEEAVFAHNSALARAVSQNNQLFEPITHPSLDDAPHGAPYCVFRLRSGAPFDLQTLAGILIGEARVRKLLFERGGSFGFRSSRFDLVEPESGETPFLRVAMGRRGGWSCDGVIRLMSEIAGNGSGRRR